MNISRTPVRQKNPPLVSAKIRNSARGQECTLRLPCCNGDPETTVLAHLRFFGWAGIAEKPHDLLAVYACSRCHDAIDRRSDADVAQWGFEDLLRAMGETMVRHWQDGRIVVK